MNESEILVQLTTHRFRLGTDASMTQWIGPAIKHFFSIRDIFFALPYIYEIVVNGVAHYVGFCENVPTRYNLSAASYICMVYARAFSRTA